ncbi:WD40 repeat-like protein [Suillus brevipes Sb2]|nr:WD40 repeat-like protein [Suillus brevipes Sb2]
MVILDAKAGSSTSAKQREVNKGQPSDSSRPVAPQKSEKYPPRYGTQHRQDALWEGGNEALPPGWTEDKEEGDAKPSYWDDALFMSTEHRPLPGVRLDNSWELIPGWEWYISPLGRSYFVTNNTRTTSWEKPRPERPAGSLMPECIIKNGSSWLNRNLACLGASGDILSVSDVAICQWTRAGKPVGMPFDIEGGIVNTIAVSPDGLMVAGACGDGRVRLWNIKEGSLVGQPWEGNNDQVRCRCLDWSPNGAEVAGGSEDGTIRRWNTSTGRQIALPIRGSGEWIWTIKYSPQGDKFATGGNDDRILVWSKGGELLIEIKGHDGGVTSLCWSKDGAYIFSGSFDGTIRKWQSVDGKELVVIRGHTNHVTSLCLFPDGSHLVSASNDYSVRIWDLEINQQLGDPLWHDDQVDVVVMSSDGQYIASSISGPDAKIYVWSLDAAALKRRGDDHSADGPSNAEPKGRPVRSKDAILHASSQVSKQQPNHRPGGLAKYGKDFWDADTNTEPRSAASPARPSFAHHWRNFLQLSTQPNAPQSIPLEPRRRNFNLLRGSSSIRTVEVAAGRKKNRIYVSPPSAAEVARAEATAAAAAQHANGNQAGSSAQAGQPQPVSGTQVSQGRPTETVTQASSGGTGDTSYEVNCCGFFFGHRRPTSHQS